MFVLAISLLSLPQFSAEADGTRSSSDRYYGYTLYGDDSNAYIVNMDGERVKTFSFSLTGVYSQYLTEDGCVLRTGQDRTHSMRGGASGGYLQKMDWDGNLVWNFVYSGSDYLPHHDIEPLPNGNVLLIVWEVKSASEAAEVGISTSSEVWPDSIVEIEQDGLTGGNVVWEWHVWDHLIQDGDATADNYGVVEDHPELIDVDIGKTSTRPPPGPSGGDWMHMNSVSYNAEHDLIAFTSHFFNEVYIIDHNTTTQEAASHSGGKYGMGGDILYRWGNPSNYGASGETVFDTVHFCNWVDEGDPGEGNLLAFNNNDGARASEVVEIDPPTDALGNFTITPGESFGPSTANWTYSEGTSMYTAHQGSNQRLPNGNTLIALNTEKEIIEVTPTGTKVWSHTTSSDVKMSLRYAPDYPGLSALKPTCTITSPMVDEDVSGQITISGSSSDPEGVSYIESVQVSIDSNDTWMNATGTGSWTFDWDSTSFFDGEHIVRARSFDGYLYSDIAEVTFNTINDLINHEPGCVIDVPINGSEVSGVVSINGSSMDPDGNGTLVSTMIRIGEDGDWEEANGTIEWTMNWDSETVENGTYAIYARSFDGFLYSEMDMVEIDVANTIIDTIPLCSIVFPVDSDIVTGNVTIEGNAEDLNGQVTEVQVRIAEGDWSTAVGTDTWNFKWIAEDLPDGEYLIQARSFDNSGQNSSVASVLVILNNSIDEVPTISITSPAEGQIMTGPFNVSGMANDVEGYLEFVEVLIDDGDWDQANGTDIWSYYIDTSLLSEGLHSVRARSFDGSQYSEEAVIGFSFEIPRVNIIPSCSIDSPLNGSEVNGICTITGSSDDDNEVVEVQVRIDDGSWQFATGTTSWSFELDTRTLSDGSHMVYVRAMDDEGVPSEEKILVLTVSNSINQAPEVIVSADLVGQTVSGTINLTGQAIDEDGTVVRVMVKVDIGEWKNATGTEDWFFLLDTTELTDGAHVILVMSIDDEGVASEESTISLTVENEEEYTGTSIMGFLIPAILGVILFLMVIILLLLVARGRRDKTSEE